MVVVCGGSGGVWILCGVALHCNEKIMEGSSSDKGTYACEQYLHACICTYVRVQRVNVFYMLVAYFEIIKLTWLQKCTYSP